MVLPRVSRGVDSLIFFSVSALCWAIGAGFDLHYIDDAISINHRTSLIDFSWGCVFAAVIGAAIAKFWTKSPEYQIVKCVWLIKIVVCLVAMLRYERIYAPLDAHDYHRYALSALPSWTEIQQAKSNGTAFVRMILTFLYSVLPSSYHMSKVIFSAIGLIGSYLFYVGIVEITRQRSVLRCAMLLCAPTVIFWGSILGKEPLALFLLGLFALSSVRAIFIRKTLWSFGVAIAIGSLLSLIRNWAPKIFLPPLIATFLIFSAKIVRLSPALRLAILIVPAIICIQLLNITPILHEQMIELFTVRKTFATGGSAVGLPFPLNDWYDFWRYLPYGIYGALFQPMPWDFTSMSSAAAGLEGLLLALFSFAALLLSNFHRRLAPVYFWLIMTCLLWAMVYGFVSTANLGTGVRYRLQIMPFVIILLILIFQNLLWLKRKKD